MENFKVILCFKVIWHWLFSPGFRVNNLVMNKVNFFPDNYIENHAIYFVLLSSCQLIAITIVNK